jgi:hypothetical protein
MLYKINSIQENYIIANSMLCNWINKKICYWLKLMPNKVFHYSSKSKIKNHILWQPVLGKKKDLSKFDCRTTHDLWICPECMLSSCATPTRRIHHLAISFPQKLDENKHRPAYICSIIIHLQSQTNIMIIVKFWPFTIVSICKVISLFGKEFQNKSYGATENSIYKPCCHKLLLSH